MHRLHMDDQYTHRSTDFIQAAVMSTPPFAPAIAAQLCPLCGQPNLCAMETERVTGIKQPPCWCAQAQFSAELLNKIPEAARGIACLCATCVQASPP